MYGIIIEMKQKYFIQQTHFVGVLLPKDLEETLENCRKYMNRTYGCKSGYGTPVHITLIPPFCLQEDFSTEDLKNGIEEYVLNRQLSFTAVSKTLILLGTGQFLQM